MDPDGTPLSYQFLVGAADPNYGPTTQLAGINLDTLGNISISAANTALLSSGRWVYKVRVTDGQGAYADRDVMVVVENPNNPTNPNPGAPILSPIGPRVVPVGSNLSFNVTGSDTGSGQRPVTVRAQLLPDGATFPSVTGGTTATSTFNWTPQPGDEGIYFVNFETFDDESVPIIDNEIVQITVTGANDPPVLNAIGNKTVPNGGNLSFSIAGSDPNGDNVSFSAFFLPPGATFNSATQTFSWTPTPAQYNNTFFTTFRITDNGIPNLIDEEVVAITVGAGNQPPAFVVIPNQTIMAGQTLTVPIKVNDATGQVVEITSLVLPSGSTFTSTPSTPPATGTFQWTPSVLNEGLHTVRLRAEDNGSPILSSIVEFTINVLVNVSPIANANGPYAVFEGDAVILDGSASTDPDGAIVPYEWDFDYDGNPSNFNAEAFSSNPTFNAALIDGPATFIVGLRITDDDGASTITTAVVDVANRVPQNLSLGGNISIFEGDTPTITLTYTDVPGDTIIDYDWHLVSCCAQTIPLICA